MEMVISNDLVRHPAETHVKKWLFRVPGWNGKPNFQLLDFPHQNPPERVTSVAVCLQHNSQAKSEGALNLTKRGPRFQILECSRAPGWLFDIGDEMFPTQLYGD